MGSSSQFGIFLALSYLLSITLGAWGLDCFPPGQVRRKLLWWKRSVNSQGNAHACRAERFCLKWSAMLGQRHGDNVTALEHCLHLFTPPHSWETSISVLLVCQKQWSLNQVCTLLRSLDRHQVTRCLSVAGDSKVMHTQAKLGVSLWVLPTQHVHLWDFGFSA